MAHGVLTKDFALGNCEFENSKEHAASTNSNTRRLVDVRLPDECLSGALLHGITDESADVTAKPQSKKRWRSGEFTSGCHAREKICILHPKDAQWIKIFEFLEVEETLRSPVSNVCAAWKAKARSADMWTYFLAERHCFPHHAMCRAIRVLQRRSRGQLFAGKLLWDGSTDVALRRISLSSVNNGVDDGIPGSLLRYSGTQSIWAQHAHPNIVTFHAMVCHSDYVELMHEWMPHNLLQWAQDDARHKNVAVLKSFLWQLLSAALEMRKQHVLHRNLTMHNVFVRGHTLKVGDFLCSQPLGVPCSPTPATPEERDMSAREYARTWTRAWELLLRPQKYSFETDVWSIGCLFAEAVERCPLFKSEGEMDHLFRVFRMCGSPDITTWPDLLTYSRFPYYSAKFPVYSKMDFLAPGTVSSQAEFVALYPKREREARVLWRLHEALGDQAMSLLDGLLTLRPHKRLTAWDALQHPFFVDIRLNLEGPQSALTQHHFFACCALRDLLQRDPACRPPIALDALRERGRQRTVEWIVKCAGDFGLANVCDHLAVKALDLLPASDLTYYGTADDPRPSRQTLLLAAACLKISHIYHAHSSEIYKTNVAERYANYVQESHKNLPCDTTDVTAAALVAAEKHVFRTIGFYHMHWPTPYNVLPALLNLSGVSSDTAVRLIDLALFDYSLSCECPFAIASLCLVTGLHFDEQPAHRWPEVARHLRETGAIRHPGIISAEMILLRIRAACLLHSRAIPSTKIRAMTRYPWPVRELCMNAFNEWPKAREIVGYEFSFHNDEGDIFSRAIAAGKEQEEPVKELKIFFFSRLKVCAIIQYGLF